MSEQLMVAPITQVTLMEDRARVRRVLCARLGVGVHKLRVEEVSPVLVAKTLQVSQGASSSGRILDAKVTRRALVVRPKEGGEDAVSYENLEVELRQRALELSTVRDERGLLRTRLKELARLAEHTLADWSEDAAWGRPIAQKQRRSYEEVLSTERALGLEIVELSSKIRDLESARSALELRLQTMSNPSRRESCSIQVSLECSAAEEVELQIEYVVPGACWRPQHTARLEGSSVAFRSDACVWQNTGEDWNQVELLFSTERISLGAEAPVLLSDELSVRKKSSSAEVVSVREQEVQTTGLGSDVRESDDELPGIDDGGEQVHLRALARSTVPSNGRAYRVNLLEFSVEAESELVAMPEFSNNVLLRTTQSNGAEVALLAGPVELLRNSGRVGRTSILYVAPGERFEIGWGPEPDLRLSRKEGAAEEKSGMFSSWSSVEKSVYVAVSNMGASSHRLRVSERIPVSEVEKVRIEVDEKESSPGSTPDEQGFVSWEVELGPRSQVLRTLRYVERKHQDVEGL